LNVAVQHFESICIAGWPELRGTVLRRCRNSSRSLETEYGEPIRRSDGPLAIVDDPEPHVATRLVNCELERRVGGPIVSNNATDPRMMIRGVEGHARHLAIEVDDEAISRPNLSKEPTGVSVSVDHCAERELAFADGDRGCGDVEVTTTRGRSDYAADRHFPRFVGQDGSGDGYRRAIARTYDRTDKQYKSKAVESV